jgi:hypothetical protein
LSARAIVVAAVLVGGCTERGSLVLVNVVGDLTGVARLHVLATAAGTTRTNDVSLSDARTPIAFAIFVPPSVRGLMSVSVAAFDTHATSLGQGSGSLEIDPGGTARLTICAGACPAGTPDLAPAGDLSRPVAALPPDMACPASDINASEYWVDNSRGSDGTGSVICPFGSITQALTFATRATQPQVTIHVAAGTYDAGHGEVFPLEVRRGITLRGAGQANTHIVGSGSYDHTVNASTRYRGGAPFGEGWMGVATLNVTLLVGDGSASNTIANLSVAPQPGTLQPLGIFCDAGNLGEPSATLPTAAPNTHLDAITVGPDYYFAIISGTSTAPASLGCNLLLTASTITRNQGGVFQCGCGFGYGAIDTAVQIGDDSMGGANTFTGNLDNGTGFLGNRQGFAYSNADCATIVHIFRNDFGNGDAGLLVGAHLLDPTSTSPFDVQVIDNSFHDLTHWGLAVVDQGEVHQLRGNSFTHITSSLHNDAVAVYVNGATAAHPGYGPLIAQARSNTIINNDNGLVINGAPLTTGLSPPRDTIDFGTSNMPGNNVIGCNATLAPGPLGYDVSIGFTGDSNGTIALAGNAWDTKPPTVATNVGVNGQDVVESNAHVLPSIILSSPSLMTGKCDPGRGP